jgi:uncharacterized protein YjbJ (UPF0337 family)
MSDERMRGRADNLKGRIKEAWGTLTGHKDVEARGFAERAEGAAREKLADARESYEGARETRKAEDEEDILIERREDEKPV